MQSTVTVTVRHLIAEVGYLIAVIVSPDLTRVTIFAESTQVTLRNDVVKTRHESRFLPNGSSRVTINNSRHESESFSQNIHIGCTKRNEYFLFQ